MTMTCGHGSNARIFRRRPARAWSRTGRRSPAPPAAPPPWSCRHGGGAGGARRRRPADRAGPRRRPRVRHRGRTPADRRRRPGEVPDEVEVRCEPTGIVVPVASVRPQNDGLHLRVLNSLWVPTRLRVTAEVQPVGLGRHRGPGPRVPVEQPVPPGELSIGCEIGGELQRRLIDLVDPRATTSSRRSACETAERRPCDELPVEPPPASMIRATPLGAG